MLLKPTLDVVASKRQAKAPEPQVMLKWLHSPSGTQENKGTYVHRQGERVGRGGQGVRPLHRTLEYIETNRFLRVSATYSSRPSLGLVGRQEKRVCRVRFENKTPPSYSVPLPMA